MTRFFENIYNMLGGKIDVSLIVIFSLAIIFLSFIFNFLLANLLTGYGIKHRLSFVFISSATCSMELFLLYRTPYAYFTLLTVFSVLILLPQLLRVKERVVNSSEKELIGFIENSIKNANQPQQEKVEVLECEQVPKRQQCESELNNELNFSHIKNVLKRLNYYNLSAFDKKQVRDLEFLIAEYEMGRKTYDLKNKLNDGLSALLKMMSKYGV